ncbi:hypothetical protein VNO77_43895 [Canavalia gladiata]|uniref:Uncharacterized protein n=1 Tax=Canavalia gladiata TaxID=3824 RepID=A0AAN9JX23_CANGL
MTTFIYRMLPYFVYMLSSSVDDRLASLLITSLLSCMILLEQDIEMHLAGMKQESLVMVGQPYGSEFVHGPVHTVVTVRDIQYDVWRRELVSFRHYAAAKTRSYCFSWLIPFDSTANLQIDKYILLFVSSPVPHFG